MAQDAEINAKAHTTGKAAQLGFSSGVSGPKALDGDQEASF